MSEQFRKYVTSSAFRLSLSENQAAVLLCLYHGDRDSHKLSHFVSGAKVLQRKGLVEHHDYPPEEWAKDGYSYTGLTEGKRPAYTVTEAGKKVCELLDIAGVAERMRHTNDEYVKSIGDEILESKLELEDA